MVLSRPGCRRAWWRTLSRPKGRRCAALLRFPQHYDDSPHVRQRGGYHVRIASARAVVSSRAQRLPRLPSPHRALVSSSDSTVSSSNRVRTHSLMLRSGLAGMGSGTAKRATTRTPSGPPKVSTSSTTWGRPTADQVGGVRSVPSCVRPPTKLTCQQRSIGVDAGARSPRVLTAVAWECNAGVGVGHRGVAVLSRSPNPRD
jgi:hypothetical protein